MSQSSLEALRAETAAGLEPVAVPLGTVTLHVRPVHQWRMSALRAMREGDFDTWAVSALTTDSYDEWVEYDPTIGEVETFFESWTEATGQDMGKSPASKRSSKRTARPSKRTSRSAASTSGTSSAAS